MSSPLYKPEDIHKALVAVEARVKASVSSAPSASDGPVRARKISTSKAFEPSTFEGFRDFELDLTCLSPPASPTPSTSNLPSRSPSPPPSPPPVERSLSRTRSFASQAIAPLIKPSKKLSTPHLSSKTMPSGSRGSWPGIKYTGRGTPIDRKRTRQWGGFISEEDEGVGEDGLLFSTARPASLDSHIRPPKRSMSPEWRYLPPLTSASLSSQGHDEDESSLNEPPPALGPIIIGSDKSDDWDSIMQSVLGSTDSTTSSESPSTPSDPVPGPSVNAEAKESTTGSVPPVDYPMMTPDQIEELHNGLETHLGIHQALDLGLGIGITDGGGRMNLFKLGLLPSSASGRETPSIYSQAETPRPSPPATIVQHDDRAVEENALSSTTTTAERSGKNTPKPTEHPWWRKVLRGMRRLQESINYHKNRFPS